MSGLLVGVPSTSRVQIEDVDYLLKVAKVMERMNVANAVLGGPSVSGKRYVDNKFKVPLLAWVRGETYS